MKSDFFEWDDEKSESNAVKHGISFEQALSVLDDPERVELTANTVDDEIRYLIIGEIEPKVYAVVVTYRNDRTRIISARRARKKEVKIYEANKTV